MVSKRGCRLRQMLDSLPPEMTACKHTSGSQRKGACSMVKKLIVVAVIGMVGFGMLYGRESCSYFKTMKSNLKEAVHESIPMEFELKRAQQLVSDLDPEIERSLEQIVKQEVELEDLVAQREQHLSSLGTQEQAILGLREQLRHRPTRLVVAGRHYSVKEVEADLSERFDRFQSRQQLVDQQHEIILAKQEQLHATRQQLEELISRKQTLEVKLAQLEAKLGAVRVAEATQKVEVDETALKRAQELIDHLDTRLEVRQRTVATKANTHGRIPIELENETSKRDVLGQIDQYFGEQEPAVTESEI